MTDTKKRKLSDILGRTRARPRFIIELHEATPDGRYLVEIEVSAQPGRKCIRLSKAVAVVFGPVLGRLVSGGGLVLAGNRVTWQMLVADPELLEAIAETVTGVLTDVDVDELTELCVRMLAGATRFRVSPVADGDIGEPGPWVKVEDDESAGEVLDDLFPTVRHMLTAAYHAARLNIRPTSPAGRTKDASSAGETSPQPAATN